MCFLYPLIEKEGIMSLPKTMTIVFGYTSILRSTQLTSPEHTVHSAYRRLMATMEVS